MSKIILILLVTNHLSVMSGLVTRTECKTTDGEPCVFPFKSDGETFNVCDYYEYDDHNYGSTFWCATSVKEDGSYDSFGTCPDDGSCPLEDQITTVLPKTTAINTGLRTTTVLPTTRAINPVLCTSSEFVCADGLQCIKDTYQCDDITDPDCKDGSDEDLRVCGCPDPSREFLCHDFKKCVSRAYRCDGDIDCEDGSDEHLDNCGCSEFLCGDGSQCVLRADRCNGKLDCADGSDELEENCGNCTSSEFACADGLQCINAAYKCDRITEPDCEDGSDEAPGLCVCSDQSRKFVCGDGSRCIPLADKCDGKNDCADGSDEDCGTDCKTIDGETCVFPFKVDDGETFNVCKYDVYGSYFWCATSVKEDGSWDNSNYGYCPEDGSCPLEGQVTTVLPTTTAINSGCPDPTREFLCGERNKCIPRAYVCDGKSDCEDWSDEIIENCGNCTSSEFACADGLQCIKAEYKCDDETDPDCRDASDEDRRVCGNCTSSEFACADGLQCIDAAYKCDDIADCLDWSDEYSGVCGCRETQFSCPSGDCIDEDWRCDEEEDCPDGADEQDCQDGADDSGCRETQFSCPSGDCIDEDWRCDEEEDCPDGADEQDCQDGADDSACSDDPPSAPEGASSDWDSITKVNGTVVIYTCSTGEEVKAVCDEASVAWKPTSITCKGSKPGGSKKKKVGLNKKTKKTKGKKGKGSKRKSKKGRKGKKVEKGKGGKKGR